MVLSYAKTFNEKMREQSVKNKEKRKKSEWFFKFFIPMI